MFFVVFQEIGCDFCLRVFYNKTAININEKGLESAD